jgi:hypothetical protein
MVKKTKNKMEEDYWEEWGEKFGDKMENWGNEFEKNFEKKFTKKMQKINFLGLLIGLFVISWGIIWLGNDLGWWNIPFPFWPIILILFGLHFILSGFKTVIFYK